MRGFPKHINTRKDVEYLLGEETHKERMKETLQRWLGERFDWITVKKLSETDVGIEDKTHRVSKIKDEETGVLAERYQQEYKNDPNCKLFRLGFPVKQAEEILTK